MIEPNYCAEQQYVAAEEAVELDALRNDPEYYEEDPTSYCGHCGTVLDENGNCPAYPNVLTAQNS